MPAAGLECLLLNCPRQRGRTGLPDLGLRPRADLRYFALERGLPPIGHGRGARLGYGAGKISQVQHTVEGRFDKAIDDRIPVGQSVTIDQSP